MERNNMRFRSERRFPFGPSLFSLPGRLDNHKVSLYFRVQCFLFFFFFFLVWGRCFWLRPLPPAVESDQCFFCCSALFCSTFFFLVVAFSRPFDSSVLMTAGCYTLVGLGQSPLIHGPRPISSRRLCLPPFFRLLHTFRPGLHSLPSQFFRPVRG